MKMPGDLPKLEVPMQERSSAKISLWKQTHVDHPQELHSLKEGKGCVSPDIETVVGLGKSMCRHRLPSSIRSLKQSSQKA